MKNPSFFQLPYEISLKKKKEERNSNSGGVSINEGLPVLKCGPRSKMAIVEHYLPEMKETTAIQNADKGDRNIYFF